MKLDYLRYTVIHINNTSCYICKFSTGLHSFIIAANHIIFSAPFDRSKAPHKSLLAVPFSRSPETPVCCEERLSEYLRSCFVESFERNVDQPRLECFGQSSAIFEREELNDSECYGNRRRSVLQSFVKFSALISPGSLL